MKNSTRIFILSLFTVIWICKPIPWETLAYRIHQREETVSKVLALGRAGGQGADSNNFVPMDPISRGSGQGSSQSFNPKPRLPYSLILIGNIEMLLMNLSNIIRKIYIRLDL